MGRLTRLLVPAAVTLVASITTLLLLSLSPASAHDDRDPTPLSGKGTVPAYRGTGPALLVCGTDTADFTRRTAGFAAALRTANAALWAQCQKSGYRSIQAALAAASQPGMTIKILPGLYQETPSLAAPTSGCASLPTVRKAALGYQVLTWEQQQECPNLQNLIAIQNKQNLQIEGTGAQPGDVVIDAQYRKLMAVRADRSPGLYLHNFTTQHTASTGVYVMESDGFAVDHVVARWNAEDGVDAFADDHGLIADCEAYGNGHAGIAAQATPDTHTGTDPGRFAVEIRDCTSHDNLLGYSGIGADSVHLHDNTFTANSTGVTTTSADPDDSTGLPQNNATVERNVIADNNADFYRFVRDGTCARPIAQRGIDSGVVCPTAGVPVGTGVVNAGGNDDVWTGNFVYGNSYAGFASWWVPGYLRADETVAAQFDTSHRNRYVDNTLGRTRNGTPAPNGVDFWWDGQGIGSCWQRAGADSEPRTVPQCNAANEPDGLGAGRYVAEPAKALKVYVCSHYDPASGAVPSDCDWYGATGLRRVEVKWALGSAVLIGLLSLLLWARLLRTGATLVALLLTLAGLVVGVYGALRENSLLTPVGLALLGLGWLVIGIGVHRRERPALGWLTIALGFFAVLGAVDLGLVMIPYIPVPPSLVRIAFEVVWAPWALVAALRGGVTEETRHVSRKPSDPLVRFANSLRW